MLRNVGEGFLSDPVQRRLDIGRQRRGWFDLERAFDTGPFAERVGEVSERFVQRMLVEDGGTQTLHGPSQLIDRFVQ